MPLPPQEHLRISVDRLTTAFPTNPSSTVVISHGKLKIVIDPSGFIHWSYGAEPTKGGADARQRDVILDAPLERLPDLAAALQRSGLPLPPGTIEMLEGLSDGGIPIGSTKQGEIEITGVLRFSGDRWWCVPVCKVKFPDGRTGSYFGLGVPAKTPHAAAVLPLTDDGHLAVIKAFRHGTREWHLEAINGVRDPGESSHEAALREAFEEAGLIAGETLECITLGDYIGNLGAEAGKHALLFVKGLKHRKKGSETNCGARGEGIASCELLTPAELLQFCRAGRIIDGKLTTMIFLASLKGLLPKVEISF